VPAGPAPTAMGRPAGRRVPAGRRHRQTGRLSGVPGWAGGLTAGRIGRASEPGGGAGAGGGTGPGGQELVGYGRGRFRAPSWERTRGSRGGIPGRSTRRPGSVGGPAARAGSGRRAGRPHLAGAGSRGGRHRRRTGRRRPGRDPARLRSASERCTRRTMAPSSSAPAWVPTSAPGGLTAIPSADPRDDGGSPRPRPSCGAWWNRTRSRPSTPGRPDHASRPHPTWSRVQSHHGLCECKPASTEPDGPSSRHRVDHRIGLGSLAPLVGCRQAQAVDLLLPECRPAPERGGDQRLAPGACRSSRDQMSLAQPLHR